MGIHSSLASGPLPEYTCWSNNTTNSLSELNDSRTNDISERENFENSTSASPYARESKSLFTNVPLPEGSTQWWAYAAAHYPSWSATLEEIALSANESFGSGPLPEYTPWSTNTTNSLSEPNDSGYIFDIEEFAKNCVIDDLNVPNGRTQWYYQFANPMTQAPSCSTSLGEIQHSANGSYSADQPVPKEQYTTQKLKNQPEFTHIQTNPNSC